MEVWKSECKDIWYVYGKKCSALSDMLLDIEVKVKSWELEEVEMLQTEHYEHVQVKQTSTHSRPYPKYTGEVYLETL